MPFYTALLIFASARTAVALFGVASSERGERPWHAVAQGAAEICCALLLRLYFVPPFRQTLGLMAWPVFAFALVWSVAVWIRRIWSLAETDEGPPAPSLLGAVGLGVSSGARRMAGVLWHVCFVAPSLVCGAFVLFGLVDEFPRR